jgi:hypothetical protein
LLGKGIGAEDEVVLTRCIGARRPDRFGLGIAVTGREWRLIGCVEGSYKGVGIIKAAILG